MNELKKQAKNSLSTTSACNQTSSKREKTEPPCRANNRFHHLRYIIISISGISLGTMLVLRLTITVAMLSMVNHKAIYMKEHPNSTAEDYFPPDYVETGEFVWTHEIQQTIIAGYMIGYTLPQVYTTSLAIKYGLRMSIPLCIVTCALSNLFVPIASYWGWGYVLFLRVINGIGASAIYPTLVYAIEIWMPYRDAAKGLALTQFNCNLLYVMSPLFSGLLCSIHWMYSFLVPAGVALILCVFWYIIVSDYPESSKFISQRELDEIKGTNESSIENIAQTDRQRKRIEVPWYYVLKIRSWYYVTFCWSLYCSTVQGFLFLMPVYMSHVLGTNVKDIGFLNFVVQIGVMFCMLFPTPISSLIMNHFDLSLTASRRIIVFASKYLRPPRFRLIIDTFLTNPLSIYAPSSASFMVCSTFGYLAMYHTNLIVVIAINRFFHASNDLVIISTLMSQFGKTGLSGLSYGMMNTVGNFSTVVFCWALGRYLDYTGASSEAWSQILSLMLCMNVLYFIVYATCCHSNPIEIDLPNRVDEPRKKIIDVNDAKNKL